MRTVLVCLLVWNCLALSRGAAEPFALTTFQADITAPLGHALMGGGIAPASEVVDPLYAKGICLLSDASPIVFVALDWCELRNDAYDRWREALAQAANTTRERVLLACIHQHDTPIADLTAQALLDEVGLEKSLCDTNFHEGSVQKVASALAVSLKTPRPITHYGYGQGEVEKVASNRRVLFRNGQVSFPRNSATTDPEVIDAPVDTIDPYLKTLSFWEGNSPVAAMSFYAVHPMSYYGKGGVSYDFVGMARERRQTETPETFQMYFSGCSGDVTAGKYNTGAPENRPVLAGRIYRGMIEAWDSTTRHPLERIDFHLGSLGLTPRTLGEFSPESMRETLADNNATNFNRNLAAMGLSWIRRFESGQPIDLPAVDFGKASFVLLPAESFVQYQLDAQSFAPDEFVVVAGYGECAPGYIPSASAIEERFIEMHDWCWITPQAPSEMHAGMRDVLSGMAE
jgi:hypothetical protein